MLTGHILPPGHPAGGPSRGLFTRFRKWVKGKGFRRRVRTIPTRELGPGPDQQAQVREWAQGVLTGLEPDGLADAVLVLDELVSNALRHGATPVRVRLVRETGNLRIEVTDAGSRPARPRPPDISGGRGLMLVDACSRQWGQWRHDAGKTVWAELAVG